MVFDGFLMGWHHCKSSSAARLAYRQRMMVMQSYEKCQKELEEKVEELKSMQTKYEDFKAVVAKVRTVEVEMEAQMEDYVRAAKDNAAKAKHWAAKLEALKEKVTKEAAD